MAAVVTFGVSIVITVVVLLAQGSPYLWSALGGLTYVLACAVFCLARLAVFVRFAQRSVRAFDSLHDNAYGIYLNHYAFVIWLQYAWLTTALPAFAKGSLVFLTTLALS